MAHLPHYPNWMHYVDGNKKLSDLTIPGTHDSGTWTLGGLYQCQTMTLLAQLHSGIRFLDIRLKPSGTNDKLQVWHGGDGATGLQFTEDIVNVCRSFLQENPSETLIMCIKDESKTVVRKEAFHNRLWGDIQSYGGLFFTEDRVPELHEVRGRIVFLRRCWAPLSPSAIGINAYKGWPDATTKEWENSAHIRFAVQDKYTYFISANMSAKFNNNVARLLNKAKNNEDRLYINFTSAIVDGGGSRIFPPSEMARVTNTLFMQYLQQNGPARYGIIPMDFPEQHRYLIKNLIDCNYESPLLLPRLRNRADGAVYLNFDGQLHHVPNPVVADAIFQVGWDWEAVPNFNFTVENPGVPLTDGCILQFKNKLGLYLSYKEAGQSKDTLRLIPNVKMASVYGLYGTGIEKPENGKSNYEHKPLLTPVTITQNPTNHDIVEIYTQLGVTKCLDVKKNSDENRTGIIIYSTNNQNNQRWKLTAAGDGYYYLEAQNAVGKVLDVTESGTQNDTPIIIFSQKGGVNQQWKLLPSEDHPGLFTISPKNAPDSCLDVTAESDTNGTAVILYEQKAATDNANQLWYFHKVDG